MLKPEQVERVRALLQQGLTIRAVAGQTGFARATVRQIATGQRTIRRGPRPRSEVLAERRTAAPPDVFNAERCPTCGGMVAMPCVLCRTREWHPIEAERLEYGTYRERSLPGYRRGGPKRRGD